MLRRSIRITTRLLINFRAFETEELQNFYETVTRRGDEPFLFDCGTIQSERAWLPNVGRLLGRLQKWEDTDIVKALMEEE